ncbi:NAD(P)-dependent dehydrogenase (short-subunit alcohol dehydrogenase family) [Azospirillum agricola]|uniref:SDR family oxidoreductase n=1 Tax=Azospirillum agricola TaxID=1720247 RepID=UPI001AE77495|nr:SDR family oxidoreductase [Azospirillum agricola]MBP2232578.1 NAD(P)-dependent dehydrogenase (short-subunit alcohol dehydrogenase family) [Azospirillum agricola]
MTEPPMTVSLITGAADGIGWAMARRFAGGGHRVVLADIDHDKAAARAAALNGGTDGSAGGGHIAVAADVAKEADVVAMVAAVTDRWGRLDVLVNNAGIGDSHLPTLDQGVEAFDRLLRIHLTGGFLAAREAGRIMVRQGCGAIVNVSSIAGLGGLPRRNAYGAAKAGIVAMTRSLACEWADCGIRVNAIAPGYVGTDLVQRLEQAGRIDMDRLKRRIPMGRLGRPEEIAEAAWFLASPQAGYITGSVLSVDGGWHAFADAGDAWSEAGPLASVDPQRR